MEVVVGGKDRQTVAQTKLGGQGVQRGEPMDDRVPSPRAPEALQQLLENESRRHEQREILDLFGRLDWDPDYDYKAERQRG